MPSELWLSVAALVLIAAVGAVLFAVLTSGKPSPPMVSSEQQRGAASSPPLTADNRVPLAVPAYPSQVAPLPDTAVNL